MAWGRVLLQVACIAGACAVPWCDNFRGASDFSFKCRRVQNDPDFENGQACQIWSNWGNKNLKEEQYTTAPPGPMRWMCPPDARPMPKMSVTFEVDERECDRGIIGSRRLLGVCGDLTSASQSLSGNSNVHINDMQTKDFPMSENCAAEYYTYNGESVKSGCWKFLHMPHLKGAFPFFEIPTIAYQKYTLDGGEVLLCELISGNVAFLQRPCQTPQVEYVWIRPSYKFYPGLSGKSHHARKCNILTRSVTQITEYYTSNDNQDNWPKYESHAITYKPFGNIDAGLSTYDNEQGEQVGFNFRAFVNFPCQYQETPTIYELITHTNTISTSTNRKFAPVNAETSKTQELCPDYVSEACFKNVYALYGMPCTWVDKKKFLLSQFRSLDYMTSTSEFDRDELWKSFREYGNGEFDFDLGSFKLQVRRYTAGVATRLPTRNVKIADSDLIEIVPEEGYSCGGCKDMPGGQGVKNDADVDVTNTQAQDIPLECELCLAYDKIVPLDFPKKKTYQRCVECEQHTIRSPDPTTPSMCLSCSLAIGPLYPMRVYAKEKVCTACMHMQYFKEDSTQGCLWYISVSDYISFNFGIPIFTGVTDSKEFTYGDPRDEYSSNGLAKDIKVVEFKQYRNLEVGKPWNASSAPGYCTSYAHAAFNATWMNLTNASRNTNPQQLYYLQWCGHHEIIRQKNARLLKEQRIGTNLVAEKADSVTLQTLQRDCPRGARPTRTKEVMLDDRVAELKCANVSHTFLYEIRREGQREQCTVCPGCSYTKQCWPTYHVSMSTVDDVYFGLPNAPSPGTCETCEERCREPKHFLNTSLFSCWSNGTARISGGDHGRLDYLGQRAAQHMNYWYKPAECSQCPSLDGVAAGRPALVTRCGNKVSFEIWHPDDVSYRDGVAQPILRECCALEMTNNPNADNDAATFVENLDAYCVTKGSGQLQCEPTVPDLATETQPYCPPGWFVSETCALENTAAWTPKCCSKCEACSLGLVKTPWYKDCPGDTFYDTQTFGCKAECLAGNYLDGDTCIPCETCMP